MYLWLSLRGPFPGITGIQAIFSLHGDPADDATAAIHAAGFSPVPGSGVTRASHSDTEITGSPRLPQWTRGDALGRISLPDALPIPVAGDA